MSLPLISLCLALVADEPPSPEKAAVIDFQVEKAEAEVAAKYGNKKQFDLTPEERRSMDKDKADASKAVLEKNGVDPKQWARDKLKQDRSDFAKTKDLVKGMDDKAKADDAKKKADANAPKEIQVQRGITDGNPVTLDEKPNEDGAIPVEKGLPPEAQGELNEAAGGAPGEGGPPMPSMDDEAAKAPKSGKGSRRR